MSSDTIVCDIVSEEESPTSSEQQVLDALSAHIAVLDEHGIILAVNKAWREFGEANLAQWENGGIGLNYLAICDRTTGAEKETAERFADNLRSVLNGSRKEFYLEYDCHAPWQNRWFRARVTSTEQGGVKRLIVTHENITEIVVARQTQDVVPAVRAQAATFPKEELVKAVKLEYDAYDCLLYTSPSPRDS